LLTLTFRIADLPVLAAGEGSHADLPAQPDADAGAVGSRQLE